MLIIIDNYDSFTYNLAQYFGELGAAPAVYRHDALTLDELIALRPTQLVISPGPGRPEESGISLPALRHFAGRIPMLGVCLGHQMLALLYGGRVDRAARPVHGSASEITHAGTGLFANVSSPCAVGRYHSLVVYEPLPAELEITARTADGEIMALQHKTELTFGVQFHPESILTPHGKQILKNFLATKAVTKC